MLIPSPLYKSNPNHDALGRFASGSSMNIGVMKSYRNKLKAKLIGEMGFHVNKETGTRARLSNRTINKISSDKAVEKSKANGFTVCEHFSIAESIVDLYENANLIDERNDTKHNKLDLRIEGYLSKPIVLQSGKVAKAYITVKHTITTDGRLIYSIEAISIKNALDLARAGRQQPLKVEPSATVSIPPSTQKSTLSWTDIEKIAKASNRRSVILCKIHNGRLVKLRQVVYTIAGGA